MRQRILGRKCSFVLDAEMYFLKGSVRRNAKSGVEKDVLLF